MYRTRRAELSVRLCVAQQLTQRGNPGSGGKKCRVLHQSELYIYNTESFPLIRRFSLGEQRSSKRHARIHPSGKRIDRALINANEISSITWKCRKAPFSQLFSVRQQLTHSAESAEANLPCASGPTVLRRTTNS